MNYIAIKTDSFELINAESSEADLIARGFEILTLAQYQEYISNQNAIQDSSAATELRILELVHPNFIDNDPSKIDFTIHLLPNVILTKKITMAKNGRPIVAKYYHPLKNTLVAEIQYVFTDNASKFMIERKEILGYYQNNNICSEYYVIHKRNYDFNIINEATDSLNERIQARQSIFQEIKITIYGFLVQYFMSQGQSFYDANINALLIGKNFFNTFRPDIADFIEVASGDFKNNVLSDINYSWLNENIAPLVSVRFYIADRLTY